MVIDLDRCVGCQAGMLACQAENNVPPSDSTDWMNGRSIRWMEMLTRIEGEEPENAEVKLIPRPCMHCDDAPCTKVCPVRATYIDDEGIVAQIYRRCIGCRMCTVACPYQARYFNWKRPEWPDEMEEMLNPDVAVRPKGVVERCTFCHHRLQEARTKARAEGREVAPEGEYVPACVEACPADAMHFGDLDDPSTKVHKLSHSDRAFRLHGELGTEPKVIYLEERA